MTTSKEQFRHERRPGEPFEERLVPRTAAELKKLALGLRELMPRTPAKPLQPRQDLGAKLLKDAARKS